MKIYFPVIIKWEIIFLRDHTYLRILTFCFIWFDINDTVILDPIQTSKKNYEKLRSSDQTKLALHLLQLFIPNNIHEIIILNLN